MLPMVLEHALLSITPGQEVAFEQAFAEARGVIAPARGFQSLTLSRCLERPNTYLLLVEWDTLADHVEGFRGSARFEKWRALLHHFFATPAMVEHFERVTAVRIAG
jgi:heme-degrading monooxygenase HmoA